MTSKNIQLQVEQLTRFQGDRILFDNLSFAVTCGTFLQIEGNNGSGKTTLLRTLVGLSQADKGQILWHGKKIQSVRSAYHGNLLFIGHQLGLKNSLNVVENLRFYQSINRTHCFDDIWLALEAVGLLGYEELLVNQLSAGQQRRVNLARLWLTDCPLWILDEPFTALDKSYISQLVQRLTQHVEQGGAIVFTSHQDIVTTDKINLSVNGTLPC